MAQINNSLKINVDKRKYNEINIPHPSIFFKELKEFKLNIIKSLPEITKYITLLNERCKGDSQLTITYEDPNLYTHGVQINSKKGESKKKKIKKNISNKKFDETTYLSPSLNEIFNTHMILCLNKKKKLKTKHERECISSIQHGFRLDSKNNLIITIDSKTQTQYERKRYNKILRLFTILLIYYLIKNYKLFTKYKDRIINNIYIESQAINPISALLSLQIGFMVVNKETNNIDKELTERLKSMTKEQLQVEMAKIQSLEPAIYTRYYINTMSEDDVMNIKQQIKNLIIGKTHNNNKTLKCLYNKNNTIKNITNVNRNRLLANNNPELIYNSSNLKETTSELTANSSNNRSSVTHNSKITISGNTNSNHTNSGNNKSK
jgi:hypothetical protein